jgi:hypothetical protein
MAVNANGNIEFWHTAGNGYFPVNWSDRRLKSNIAPATDDALSIINRMQVYSGILQIPWDGAPAQDRRFMLMADEIKDLLPEAYVHVPLAQGAPPGSEQYDGINDQPLMCALVRAVQQLTERLEKLEHGRP